ncbi:MAG: dipeptidase PepE [Maribacter sp.]
MTNCLLASTSTIFGGSYLEYLFDSLRELFSGTDEVLFIPYARPGGTSYDAYTKIAQEGFSHIDKKIVGIHTFNDPIKAILNAKGIFTGGGNSFVLVNTLYQNNLLSVLKEKITNGTPYLGTSAGSNIAGLSIKTTNDMPIVYPPSFETMGIVPFTINPHYLDPDPTSKHKGETRETRIKEFHEFNTDAVVGLREGSWIRVRNNKITLKGGELSARIFEKDKKPYELSVESSFNFI